jgi:hypothetical protein
VLVLLLVLAACQSDDEPEPLIVFVTVTPEVAIVPSEAAASPSNSPIPPPTLTPTMTATAITGFPSATLTPTIAGVDSPTPFLSPTPSTTPQEFPTATLTPTIEGVGSPTPFPTLTPTQFGMVDNGSTAHLPGFPTATLTATIEGVPSPTPLPITPTPNRAVDVAIAPPAAVSDLAPPPDQLPVLAASEIGIQLHPFVTNEEWANALGLTQQLAMGWIKFQLRWDVAEPQQGNYSFEYERLVLLVQQAHIQGFHVLVSVTRAPDWARPAGANLSEGGPPTDPQLLADFITRLVTDIKPEFLDAVEIWNEPNLNREWANASMDGATYMQYFTPAYHAVKAVDPHAIVSTAGLAPVGEVPGAADDRRFLREMYAAGLADLTDVRIGVHPYGWANPPDARCCSTGPWQDNTRFFMLDTLDAYREIMVANNDADGRLWVTEFGWGSYEGITVDGTNATPPEAAAFFDMISQIEQAEYTVRALEILQQEPYSEFVDGIFLWNMNFATIENAIPDQLEQAGYSLLNAAGRPRPVFYYLLNTRKFYETTP